MVRLSGCIFSWSLKMDPGSRFFFQNGRTLIRELRTRCLVVILRVISANAFCTMSVETLALTQYPG